MGSTETMAPTVPHSGGLTHCCGERGSRAGGQKQASDVVRLRLVPCQQRTKKKKVHWAADVVDNEFLGRKSSKKCCIFHKRREFGDWSESDTEDEHENDGGDCHCHK